MMDAQRILVIAPHPDDEVLGCGGTIALCAERGADVHVLVVFNGAAGDPRGLFAESDYVGLRRTEARRGGRCLGVGTYHFWDLPEGHLASEQELEEGARRLAEFIAELGPQLVLAPWCGDDHVDHQTVAAAVSRWVGRADVSERNGPNAAAGLAQKTPGDPAVAPRQVIDVPSNPRGCEVWGFEVWSELDPDHLVDVSAVWATKLAALAHHRTQLAYRDLFQQMTDLAARSGSGQYERFQRWGACA